MNYNPALYEEPRNQPIKVIPPALRESLLDWLENTGRFHTVDVNEYQDFQVSENLDEILEPEIYILETEEEPVE